MCGDDHNFRLLTANQPRRHLTKPRLVPQFGGQECKSVRNVSFVAAIAAMSERRTIASPSMRALSTGSAATASRIRVKALE
jgi:hypothetical protein